MEKRLSKNRYYYCVGFTASWLASMSMHIMGMVAEQQWDKNIAVIMRWDLETPLSQEQKEIFDKVIGDIILLANRDVDRDEYIDQYSLDKSLSITLDSVPVHPKKLDILTGLFTAPHLQMVISEYLQDETFVMIGDGEHEHATGIIKQGEFYYYYDSDSPKKYLKTKNLAEIVDVIFKNYDHNLAPLSFHKFTFGHNPIPPINTSELLERYATIEFSEEQRCDSSILILAARLGDLQSVDFYLKKNPEWLNYRDSLGNRAFDYAVKQGHPAIVSRLLKERDTDINGTNRNGLSALFQAIILKNTDIAHLLLDNDNIDVNKGSYRTVNSCLLMAAITKQNDIVKKLLQKGAHEPNFETLKWAIKEQNLPLLKLLLQSSAYRREITNYRVFIEIAATVAVKKLPIQFFEKHSKDSWTESQNEKKKSIVDLFTRAYEIGSNPLKGNELIGIELMKDDMQRLYDNYKPMLEKSKNKTERTAILDQFKKAASAMIQNSVLNTKEKSECQKHIEALQKYAQPESLFESIRRFF